IRENKELRECELARAKIRTDVDTMISPMFMNRAILRLGLARPYIRSFFACFIRVYFICVCMCYKTHTNTYQIHIYKTGTRIHKNKTKLSKNTRGLGELNRSMEQARR